ncbi:hypothetical protein SAMN05444159_4137 [Bradyrhizobium lablabi]|uniref:Uncharacterized protein n=1 Tax=Bradyrhizobium lablabi TaxID=722472 RepID=A0A1M6V5X1_9BRAD|nr:hypothetical protein SAMN05444159_4137 [Bradyrhizobium lablabi]
MTTTMTCEGFHNVPQLWDLETPGQDQLVS